MSKRNPEEALKWYIKSTEYKPNAIGDAPDALQRFAEQGVAEAQYKFGQWLEFTPYYERLIEAVKWYRKAAEQGHAQAKKQLGEALFKLGNRYATGNFDHASEQTPPWWPGADHINVKYSKEALKCYREAGDLGNVEALFKLGDCYAKGLGVEKDLKEAVKWYRMAAEQGYARAQSVLGWYYVNGRVTIDPKEAIKWYTKAAEQGYTGSPQGLVQVELGDCYAIGLGVKKDPKEAIRWYTMAAKDSIDAKIKLGDCYAKGLGVEKDLKEAVKWYRIAVEQHDSSKAKKRLRDLGYSN